MQFEFQSHTLVDELTIQLRGVHLFATLAAALRKLGHDAFLTGLPPKTPSGYIDAWDVPIREGTGKRVRVVPVHSALGTWPLAKQWIRDAMSHTAQAAVHNPVVGVQVRCKIHTDPLYMKTNNFAVIMMVQYHPRFNDHPRLLPVPFILHRHVLLDWAEKGWIGRYIDNDIEFFREQYHRPKEGLLGYRGGVHWRRTPYQDSAPDWADVKACSPLPMTASEHATWLSGFYGGLYLPGERPKSFIHPLLALLGVAIVVPRYAALDTPQLDDNNSIAFTTWDDVRTKLEDAPLREAVVQQATQDYLDGWSPLGQARHLVRMLEVQNAI